VVETSLGYFINPLMSVVLGVVLFSERLRRLQWVAVGIATLAVVVLTVDYGRPPWIALTLALSFALYGVMKKLVRTEAVPGLFVETALVALPAAVVLGMAHSAGAGTFGNAGTGHALLLVVSGVATAIPLLLFAAAARRIPLSTVGLLQYLTPSTHLAIGVFVYHEPMPPTRLAGFAIVWIALAVFTADTLRHARANSRRETLDRVPVGL
jgi:chloramphenicol-sensitive protein RarD